MKLSLLIPTYNRCAALRETLDSFLPQLVDGVELVVVDGASPDATRQVVQEFVRQSPRVRYVQLSQKGGIDRDYDLGVSECRGEWVWLLADEDVPAPHAVQCLLDALDASADLIVINADVFSPDYSTRLTGPRLSIRERLVIHDTDELFRVANDHMSFIAAVCIRRSVWLEREREPFFGTEFIHLGVIFQAPLRGSAIILPDVLLHIRYGVGNWARRAFEVWMFKWPRLAHQHAAVSSTAKAGVNLAPWQQFRVLLKHRAFNSLRAETLDLLRRENAPWSTLMAARVLIGLPQPVAAALAAPVAIARGTDADKILLFDARVATRQWLRDQKSRIFSPGSRT